MCFAAALAAKNLYESSARDGAARDGRVSTSRESAGFVLGLGFDVGRGLRIAGLAWFLFLERIDAAFARFRSGG